MGGEKKRLLWVIRATDFREAVETLKASVEEKRKKGTTVQFFGTLRPAGPGRWEVEAEESGPAA